MHYRKLLEIYSVQVMNEIPLRFVKACVPYEEWKKPSNKNNEVETESGLGWNGYKM